MFVRDFIRKHLGKSIAFGIIMTIIGFFRGDTVFTFPPVWLDLLKLFLIYSVTFLAVNVLADWMHGKPNKD